MPHVAPPPSRQFIRAREPADVERALQELYDNQTRLYNAWTPVGTIIHWLGPANAEELGLLPEGWLISTGQVVGQSDYPVLSNLIGVAYNEVGGVSVPAGSFRLPDLRDRFMQFSKNLDGSAAGQIGAYEDSMEFKTVGGTKILRLFVLPLIRVG